MAIQDYVRSIAATETVSKDQVFRFLEMQFARADRDHDGELDADELAAFVLAVSTPEADQRQYLSISSGRFECTRIS